MADESNDVFNLISSTCIFNEFIGTGGSSIILKSLDNRIIAKIVFLDMNKPNYKFHHNIKNQDENNEIQIDTMEYIAICDELEIHNEISQVLPNICPQLYGARFNIKNLQAIIRTHDKQVLQLLQTIQADIDSMALKPCIIFMEYINAPTLYQKYIKLHTAYNDQSSEMRKQFRNQYGELIEQTAFVVISLLIKTHIFHADYTKRNIMILDPPKLIDFGYAIKIKNEDQLQKIHSLFYHEEYLSLMQYLYTFDRNDGYTLNYTPEVYGFSCGAYNDFIDGSSLRPNFDSNVQLLFNKNQYNIIQKQIKPFYFNNIINMPVNIVDFTNRKILFNEVIKLFMKNINNLRYFNNRRSIIQTCCHMAVYFVSEHFDESKVYFVLVTYMTFFGFFYDNNNVNSHILHILYKVKSLPTNNKILMTEVYKIINNLNKNNFIFYNFDTQINDKKIYDLSHYFNQAQSF